MPSVLSVAVFALDEAVDVENDRVKAHSGVSRSTSRSSTIDWARAFAGIGPGEPRHQRRVMAARCLRCAALRGGLNARHLRFRARLF